MAVNANCHRDAKAKPEPFTAADFHLPELQKKAAAKQPRQTAGIGALKVFIKKKPQPLRTGAEKR